MIAKRRRTPTSTTPMSCTIRVSICGSGVRRTPMFIWAFRASPSCGCEAWSMAQRSRYVAEIRARQGHRWKRALYGCAVEEMNE